MTAVGSAGSGALGDDADDVGRVAEFKRGIAGVDRSQPVALVLDPILPEDWLSVYPRDHVGAGLRMSGRVDDDDAAVREFRLHAVAEHAQGIGLVSRAAGIVQHGVLDVGIGGVHRDRIRAGVRGICGTGV